MSDELVSELRRQVSEMRALLEKKNAESTDRRHRLKAAEAEHAKLADELAASRKQVAALEKDRDAAAAERDDWKGKVEMAPGEAAKRLQELEADLRTRDHRDAWAAAVGGELAERVKPEHVWREIGYQPTAEIPQPHQIREQVRKAREAAPFLFRPGGEPPAGAPGGATGPPPSLPPLVVGDAGSRGARDAAGRMTYRRADVQKPGWQTTNKALHEAISAGNAVEVD